MTKERIRTIRILRLGMKNVSLVCALWLVSAAAFAGTTVVSPRDAAPQAKLAAKEITRYFYLRSG